MAVTSVGGAVGALSGEQTKDAAEKNRARITRRIQMSSPFMTHYYLEALYACGMEETAKRVIRNYWGAIINAGFDCCPECFDVTNDRVTPYSTPVLNSACHAWSCTPSYLPAKRKGVRILNILREPDDIKIECETTTTTARSKPK